MPSRALPRWALAASAFVLGAVVALAAAVAGYYALARAGTHGPTPPPRPPTYAREEFSRKVMGKTEDEVIHAVGRPDETTRDNESTFWHFKNRTLDSLTQELDTDVQVVIKGGKVAEINY